MQVHFYARSISGIALQLGLPAWFVELRHAATHEAVPSLAVLRAAAHHALAWLNARYWLPLLSAGGPSASAPRDLEYLQQELNDELRKYKVERKDALRDVTKEDAKEVAKICKALDRIIHAHSLSVSRDDVEAASGIAVLVDVLMIPGGLVPASKKKRKSAKWTLPDELFQIWDPLLDYFDDAYEAFGRTLLSRIVGILSRQPAELAGESTRPLL
jgi:ribosomal biogenesis protein LAS1